MNYVEPKPVKSSGKHPCVEWNGKRWYKTQHYYVDRRGVLLHREVYKSVHGNIPENFQVHHINEDKADNRIENLIALSASEHIKAHEPRGAVRGDFDKSVAAKAMWDKRQPRKVICAECGTEFETIGTRSKFCSPNCNSLHFYYKKRGKR